MRHRLAKMFKFRFLKFKFPSRKRVLFMAGVAALVAFASLPFLAGTRSYPIAIVDGSSMSPNLHNGDLVIYSNPAEPLRNGTVIVFTQSQSGVPALDSLLMPTVIHRVVGTGHEPDGTLYYQTKGDNNIAKDPFVTDSGNVLGTPMLTVPYAGLPIQFLKTPFGMVAITALMSLYFISDFDSKFEDEKERKRLVAVFARHTLNGDMSAKAFEKLKLAIEYSDEIPTDLISDPMTISLVDWLRGGGLSTKWKEEKAPCPICGGKAFGVVNHDTSFLLCPSCDRSKPWTSE